MRTYLSTELFRSERAQAAMFSWPLGVKTKYVRGTYHVIKCTGPSAQISYCKRRTCARPGNEARFSAADLDFDSFEASLAVS